MTREQRLCLLAGGLVMVALVVGPGLLLPISVGPLHLHYETNGLVVGTPPPGATTTIEPSLGSFYVYDGVETRHCAPALRSASGDHITQDPPHVDGSYFEIDPCLTTRHSRQHWLIVLVLLVAAATLVGLLILGRRRPPEVSRSPDDEPVGVVS